MSDSLWSHGLPHTRLPCPINSWSLLKLTSIESMMPSNTSSSVVPFSSCLQSFPGSGSFPRTVIRKGLNQGLFWFFTSDSQGIGASASASVLPMSIRDWFHLGLTGLISQQTKGLLRVFPNTTIGSINSLALRLLYGPTLPFIHDCWRNHSFDYTDLCRQSDISAFYYCA